MKLALTGKTALVCGSTQGIGKAVALELALLGANIILLARNEEKLRETLLELPTNANQKHRFISADFNQPLELKRVVGEFIQHGVNIHILINNTGGPKGGAIKDADPSEFIMAFNQHLICNHLLAQLVYPGMIADNYGRIINIISTSVKQPLPNLGVSNTIRGAVASWSKTLANELGAYGITVNNVLPGATNTQRLQTLAQIKAEQTGDTVEDVLIEMGKETPMKRIALPEEIASAVAFLASPAAAYINGINVPVDGGRTKCL